MIVATAPELCQKIRCLPEEEDQRNVFVCSGICAYFSSNARQDFNVKKVRNLRLEHFESCSSFSFCMHSSVYQVFWPSGRVVDCFILIKHSTTGPVHPIYRTMRTV